LSCLALARLAPTFGMGERQLETIGALLEVMCNRLFQGKKALKNVLKLKSNEVGQ